jgi:limonene-1,2-epoxide hydrolase
MPEPSSQAIVEKFIDAWNRMDFEAIINALHRDVTYHNIPMAALQGRETVREYLHSAWRFEAVDWQTINIASVGNTVLTERVDNFVINGAPVALPVMGVFEIVDDKIFQWRDYFDLASYKAQLAAAAGDDNKE